MQRIRAGDADIAFDVTGVGDPLLLIMGLGADSKMWMLQTPTFSERLRCITFDNRGVGESSIPEGPYSTEQMAGDALAVLDALDVERAHVLGISLGGAIAQQVALKAPERVRSLCSRRPGPNRTPTPRAWPASDGSSPTSDTTRWCAHPCCGCSLPRC